MTVPRPAWLDTTIKDAGINPVSVIQVEWCTDPWRLCVTTATDRIDLTTRTTQPRP
jgi:hypothetical protein